MADVFVGDKPTVTPASVDKAVVLQSGAVKLATIATIVQAGVDAGAVPGQITALQAADTALDGRLDTAEGEIDALQAADTALQGADTALDGRLDTAEGTLVSHGTRITTAEGEIDALQAADIALDGRLDAAEPAITALQGADTALDGRLDTAESTLTSHGTRITTAEGEIDALQTATVPATIAATVYGEANSLGTSTALAKIIGVTGAGAAAGRANADLVTDLLGTAGVPAAIGAGVTVNLVGNTNRPLPTTLVQSGLVSPFDFDAVGDGVTDDAVPLQDFFDWVEANAPCQFNMNGTFATSTKLTLTGAIDCEVIGNCSIVAISWSSGDYVLEIANSERLNWNGKLEILGVGGTDYTTRTIIGGLLLNEAPRAHFAFVRAAYFKRVGIYVLSPGNSNHVSFGKIVTQFCGPGGSGVASKTISFTTRSDAGSVASFGQTSTLTMSAAVPTEVKANDLVKIGSYLCTVVSYAGSSLVVFPWPDTTLATGDVQFLHGGGLILEGNDANCVSVSSMEATSCSVGIRDAAFAGASIDSLMAQQCGVAFAVGNGPQNTQIGGLSNQAYFEDNLYDIVRVTQAVINRSFDGTSNLSLTKCLSIAPRTTGNVPSHFYDFAGITISSDQIYAHNGGVQGNNAPSTIDLTTTLHGQGQISLYSNSQSFRLKRNVDANRLFAVDTIQVLLFGSGANNESTAAPSFVLDAADQTAGQTVMGGTSYTPSAPTRPTLYFCVNVGTNWRVMALSFD